MATAEEVKKRVSDIQARAKNLRPVLTVLAQDLRTFVDDRFATSTGPNGRPWADLSESALESRARRAAGPSVVRNRLIGPLPEGASRTRRRAWTRRRSERAAAAVFNAKPLIDTGRLRQSIATRVGRTELAVGTNVVYGGTHQFGSEDGLVPARPFLPFSSSATGSSVEPVTTGPAQQLWDRIRESVRAFILTGQIR